jgi:hypothetical protein
MSEPRICTTCGKGQVEPVRKPGRTMVFRNFESLEVPESLAIPTCSDCGDEWFDAETTEALERALAEAASNAVRAISVEAIAELSEYVTQRDLEDLLDLSHGYLSKVKHGKEKPSALLTALLALLASAPEKRLEEVRRFWSARTIAPRLPSKRTASS